MAQFVMNSVCDLSDSVRMTRIGGLFAQNDKLAHSFSIKVTNKGVAADLSDLAANGYFIRPDEATVTIPGTISGSDVTVALPAACYEVPGHFSIIIKLYDTDHSTPIYWGDGMITRSETDAIVDPAHVVPDLAALLAQIATIEAAVEAANAAADRTENMTVSASAASGSTPSATITTVDDHYNIDFELVKGDKGDTGNTGNGINEASCSVKYQESASGTVVPTGTWLDSPPSIAKGNFLWTKTTLSFTSGNTQVFYSVGYDGVDGTGTTPFTGATATTAGATGWVPAPAAGEQNKFLCGNGDWEEALLKPATATLSTSGWGSSPIAQTVTVSGVTSSNIVIIAPDPSSIGTWGECNVRCTAQETNSLTFSADTLPETAITVNVLIVPGGAA